jgi:hypothetical protein
VAEALFNDEVKPNLPAGKETKPTPEELPDKQAAA